MGLVDAAVVAARAVGERRGDSRVRVVRTPSRSCLLAAVEAVAEAPGLGAGVDDVRAVGEPIDDGFGHPGVGEHLGPLAERQVGGHDQRPAFVQFGEDLEDELGGAVWQGEIAELVEADDLGAGVAADDPAELPAAVGLLELVREGSEGGEPDPSSLVAGANGERDGRCVLPVPLSPIRMMLSRSLIQDPSARAAIVACGTFGLSAKRNSSSRLICGNRASLSLPRWRRSARS